MFVWVYVFQTGSDPDRVGHIHVYYKEGFEPNRVIGFYSTTNNKTEGRSELEELLYFYKHLLI